MDTDFVLVAEKFNSVMPDHTPEHTAECCKWFEDMLTLANPEFKDLTADQQCDFYFTGVVRSLGWQYVALDPVRVFVLEDGGWNIRHVPTKELAEKYIKKFSSHTPINWFFYDASQIKTIED